MNKQKVLVLFHATVDEASPVFQWGGIMWFLTIKRCDESNTISFQPAPRVMPSDHADLAGRGFLVIPVSNGWRSV